MPCKTSPAATPLQLSLQSGLKFADWMRALSALESNLADAPGNEAPEPIAARLRAALQSLMRDEELSDDVPAAEAIALLSQHEPRLAGDLARALVCADRQLGRARFQFSFGSGSAPGKDRRTA